MNAPNASDRIHFFARADSHGQRSFQLRRSDVNEKKLSLMSAMNDFYLRDSHLSEEAQPIEADASGSYNSVFDASHTYEVVKRQRDEASVEQWVRVGTEAEIQEAVGRRKRLPVHSRDVLVCFERGDYYAMDAVCYHFGGPLIEGDIEELDGHLCIVCPWHKYRIDMSTGEGLLKKADGCSSKGVKQRVHHVKVEDGTVWVKLDTSDTPLASDHYAHMGLWKHPTQKTPPKVHSGMVFQQGKQE